MQQPVRGSWGRRGILVAAVCVSALTGSPLPATAQSADIVTRSSNGIAYATGGVGDDSLRALKAMQAEYNLSLLFAERSGEYLASIPVRIEDRGGHTLLEATADGPYFLVRLPAGRYKVTATHNNQPITRQVTVPAAGQVEESFYWAKTGG